MTPTLSRRVAGVKKSGVREIFDVVQSLPDVIDLGIGQPDFKTPEFVRSAAIRTIKLGGGYTSNQGILELRREVAKKLKRENGVEADRRKRS